MPKIYVDNKAYEIAADEKGNLLQVCLSLGLDIPYFCWHPAMHSVGACRQCAVKLYKDEADTKGKIVMSCMTHAAPGVRISIDDEEVVEFRRSVIEWLMANHPHDCPVCDEGGECHLQDMTILAGHAYRRHRFAKRTFRNQDLGPLVAHEMNRCIQCYRCVRFYRDYAGGEDLSVLGWHDRVYFGRHASGVLQSEFSGNLVEVCPTGVFTDKTLGRHYSRKWDLQTAPAVCVHCGVGCNTIPGERAGSLRRIRNRYHHEVNRYFLCDRGRYGYEFVNSPRRVRRAMRRTRDGHHVHIDQAEALRLAADILRDGKTIGIGSPRASLESNYALRRLVGAERFYHGMPATHLHDLRLMLRVLQEGPAPAASLRDAAESDTVLVLGEDTHNVAPMLALSLRQAVVQLPIETAHQRMKGIPVWLDAIVREVIQQNRGPFFVATPHPTKLDDAASLAFRLIGPDIARLGYEIAHAIDEQSPTAPDLADNTRDLAHVMARQILRGQRPLVVAGFSTGDENAVRAAANVAWALRGKGRQAKLAFTVPECNSLGAAMIGGGAINDALDALRLGQADTLVVVENDLFRHADAESVEALLAAARHVIVLDSLEHATAQRATLVLPAATFAEAAGTMVNYEGRAQRSWPALPGGPEVKESWRWLGELIADRDNAANPFANLDAVLDEMGQEVPILRGAADAAPRGDFRLLGMRVPRQPNGYSGRAALTADRDVREPGPPPDADSPLAYSMEGYPGRPPGPLLSHYWAPGWNSPQALNKFQQEVGGPLRGGESGRRLIEPSRDGSLPYFMDVPDAFQRIEGKTFFVPAWHIFGSEELSMHSPPIAQLAPQPYVGLSLADATAMGVAEGGEVYVVLERRTHRLAVKIFPLLPRGAASLPMGLPGLAGLTLPAWGHVHTAPPPPREGGRP